MPVSWSIFVELLKMRTESALTVEELVKNASAPEL